MMTKQHSPVTTHWITYLLLGLTVLGLALSAGLALRHPAAAGTGKPPQTGPAWAPTPGVEPVTTTVYLPAVMNHWPRPTWQTQCVDCPPSIYAITHDSIAVDSAGRPHVVYGGDGLYHAVRTTGWQIDKVDAGGRTGAWAAIALDANDDPHIAYTDRDSGDALRYATWDGANWVTETITGYGWHAAIALDDQGRPHVAYRVPQGLSGETLNYAYRDGDGWHDEVVVPDITITSSPQTSLVIDGAGRPHIGYNLVPGGSNPSQLVHVYHNGTAWQEDVAATAPDDDTGIGDNAMTLTSDDNPCFAFAFYEGNTTTIRYASYDQGQWQVSDIETASGLSYAIDLAVDDQNTPHVSHYQGGTDRWRHAVWNGGWQTATVEENLPGLGWGEAGAVAVDGSGAPHLVTYLADARLRYATQSGSTWAVETVTRAGDAGQYTSLALDSAGRPHIVHRDEDRRELKYMAWDGAAWQTRVVDTGGWVNALRNSDLALDSTGRPHIAYYYNEDLFRAQIRYAVWDGAQWQTQIVASTDAPPLILGGAALALDAADRPHIAYYTQDNHHYAVWDGAQWQVETIDTLDGYQLYPMSMALDGAGRPHVTYFDNANKDLRYAVKVNGSWQVQTVEGTGNVGAYPSLALDAAGHPRIAYCLLDTVMCQALRYAVWDGAAWQITTVDNGGGAGEVGAHASLALDSSDHPHIAYVDNANGALKLATWDGATWQLATALTGNVGQYASLALDGQGLPHISHHDGTHADLLYTWLGP